MTITQHISIDLQQPGNAPMIHAVQGDEYSRKIEIELYSNGVSWNPPDGCEVAIRYGKPDGKGGIYAVLPDNTPAYSIAGNAITVTLAPQMVTVPGVVEVQVSIIKDRKDRLSTFSFAVDVEADPSKGELKSENYVNWKSYYIPQTTGATVGQFLQISKVDDVGRIIETSPVENPAGEATNKAYEALRIANDVAQEIKDYSPSGTRAIAEAAMRTASSRLVAPQSASVGQYFRVKEVDANGVVTAVEAVDAPSGGGSDTPGEDGFSPVATVEQTENGAVITITDRSGTTTATVANGKDGTDGQDGSPGKDGSDGVSPTVAVSKSGKVTTVSITDKSGTKTATINDGADGSPGSAGKDGTSVTVKSVSESSADGGSNVVTFSDGKTLTIKNGSKGSTGATGADGKTAYQYAQDGGYIGTEAEFAEKLAGEYTLNPLHGKKVSFLGDSICSGSSESTSYLGGYGKIIADRNGMVYENVAHAGATVTAETYSRTTGNAKPWLCRMVENMSADADYAIIEGGLNDGWDETVLANIGSITTGYDAELDDTTYYGAFESMLKQLVTKFQGKKIGYIAVPKIHGMYDSSRNAPNCYHIALECCAKWGVSVCDLNTITPPVEYLADLGTEYTADACHPTYEGYLKYYCDPIEAWMKTLTTGASVGQAASVATDDFVLKNDVQIKKAQLTLEDGSTVLIDVVVASAGTTINTYLNLIPTSIDTDGSIYNGTGFKINTRLSSSGEAKPQSGCVATGFIPAVGGDTIYLGGDYPWYISTANNNYLCAYDSNFNFIGAVYNTVSDMYYTKNIAAGYELGDVCKITLINDANIAYIRASWGLNWNNDGSGIIVTVNQEIT